MNSTDLLPHICFRSCTIDGTLISNRSRRRRRRRRHSCIRIGCALTRWCISFTCSRVLSLLPYKVLEVTLHSFRSQWTFPTYASGRVPSMGLSHPTGRDVVVVDDVAECGLVVP